MSKFSFQIEPVAEFHNLRGKSPLRALRSKLFGKTGFRDWAPAAMTPLAASDPAPKRLGLAPARKPACIVAFRPLRTAAQPAPKAAEIPPAAKPVAYKGRAIWATQIEDGSWIAMHTSRNGEPNWTGRKQESYLARFLAIAGVELEIDELQMAKLAA